MTAGEQRDEEALRLDLTPREALQFFDCIDATKRALELRVVQAGSVGEEVFLWPSERIARLLLSQGERLPDWLGLLHMIERYTWRIAEHLGALPAAGAPPRDD